jgi:two-component system, NtrC family, sensor kinase
MFSVRSSLKTRILLLTGSVITLLMLLISFVLLIKWREIIIQKQSENAVSIAQTFAVAVVDAMIFEEESIYKQESILETYVESFMSRVGNVKYVVITDKNGVPIIQITNHSNYNSSFSFDPELTATHLKGIKIYDNPQLGWTMEVHQPLIFSTKHWGAATIGFDAQLIRDEISDVFILLLVTTILITSIVLLILFLSIRQMTSSLERLVHVIDSIDFSSEVQIDLPQRQDEIGFFYNHFKSLQGRLESSKKELEQAQKQIYQAEKLASIGRLASGVAHQVNNPLNGIKSCLYAIQQNSNSREKIYEYLNLINEGINDIETVVKKLLGFARQQSTSKNLINMNDAIHKVINLFELRLKEKLIDIQTDLADDIGEVQIDYHLFQEVVMNLILNSYDAIEKNGSIRITTGKNDDDHVFMEIRDTGAGISPDDLKKIFDPFFTTKDVGTGTGLGLSVCMGIIESHGGRIEVQSTQNVETMFRILLPVAQNDKTLNH